MAKQKEYESKSVKYNTSVSDKIFTVINTLFMIAFVVITLYPVLNTLAISLNDGTDALRGGIYLFPRKWTLQNYKTVIHKNNLINGAVVSVARTFIGTLTSLAANALLAFIVSRKRFLFKSQLSLFWVVTMYVNGGLIPVFLLYKGLNLTNSFWVYIVPGMLSAFNMLVIRTYMTGIPDSLEESAQLDGAGYMTLQYELMKLLSSVTNQGASAESMKNATAASAVTPTSVRAAATILTMLPIVCLYPFLQRYFITGLTIGGVKE